MKKYLPYLIISILLLPLITIAAGKIDSILVNRLKGRILLQVQQQGEAWYVNPTDGKRYYMKDGATAYEMMRKFGLGITDADLEKIPVGNLADILVGTSKTESNKTISENTSIQPISLSTETWAELETRYFAEANQKNWTTLIITNAQGEKRYYRKEGTLWYRKNSEAEMQQIFVVPPIPTVGQLATVRRVCLWDANLKAICDKPEFMDAYYSNEIFRTNIDTMFKDFLAIMSDQQKQKVAAEKSTLDCLMAPTPESERVLDPATQNYLRQIRCGTVTAADKTNYELSRIKTSVDELKYRLDSKIAFPPLLLDPIQAPTFTTPRWEIRWEGSGGRISDSLGNSYQFTCDFNFCRSY